MNNPHSAYLRSDLGWGIRWCGSAGFLEGSAQGNKQYLFLGIFSPHCRSRDHTLDFPTTSWHLSRLVVLIAPHEFGEASSSVIFDLEHRLPKRSIVQVPQKCVHTISGCFSIESQFLLRSCLLCRTHRTWKLPPPGFHFVPDLTKNQVDLTHVTIVLDHAHPTSELSF
jgi:hypothetical protein